MQISDERYEQIALADPEGHWELHKGRLVPKPTGLGATDMREDRYERIALADPEGKWELDCGRLRSKPPMTTAHNQIARVLGFRLQSQLPWDEYVVSVDTGRVRRPTGRYYVPDVAVIPAELVRRALRERPTALEAYGEPLPLVVEVWSPRTGEYDVETKLEQYQQRGDREIWRVHPIERTLTAWRRQPNESYTETVVRGGIIEPVALSGVRIDLDALFTS
jgi:Uma2 family endonuclease